MKGYRTLAFGVSTILLGLLGKHLSPDLINEYLDVIFAFIGLGIIGLRLITSAPAFAVLAHDVGLSDDAIATIRHELVTVVSAQNLTFSGVVDDINHSLSTIAGHPLLAPDTANLIKSALEAVKAPADPVIVPAASPAPESVGAGPAAPETLVNGAVQ